MQTEHRQATATAPPCGKPDKQLVLFQYVHMQIDIQTDTQTLIVVTCCSHAAVQQTKTQMPPTSLQF